MWKPDIYEVSDKTYKNEENIYKVDTRFVLKRYLIEEEFEEYNSKEKVNNQNVQIPKREGKKSDHYEPTKNYGTKWSWH